MKNMIIILEKGVLVCMKSIFVFKFLIFLNKFEHAGKKKKK